MTGGWNPDREFGYYSSALTDEEGTCWQTINNGGKKKLHDQLQAAYEATHKQRR